MKLTVEAFRAWDNKCITLLGMSGVGKTYLSGLLRRHDWFHYSGDYRIGTRYLDEHILDLIKGQAMQVPFLRDLLRRGPVRALLRTGRHGAADQECRDRNCERRLPHRVLLANRYRA